MKLSSVLVACAFGLAAAGAARAEDLTVSDLKCVVVFGSLINNPQYRDAAGVGIYYFLGRAEGREPGLDVATALKHLREGLPFSQYADEGKRCGAALKDKNDWLKAISIQAAQSRRGVG